MQKRLLLAKNTPKCAPLISGLFSASIDDKFSKILAGATRHNTYVLGWWLDTIYQKNGKKALKCAPLNFGYQIWLLDAKFLENLPRVSRHNIYVWGYWLGQKDPKEPLDFLRVFRLLLFDKIIKNSEKATRHIVYMGG